MSAPRRPLVPLAIAVALAGGLAGCGGSGGWACSGNVCTVQADGPLTTDVDDLGTEVELSDLTADAVRVRVNAEERVVRRGQAVRLRGFLVTATQTGTKHVEVRLER